MFSLDILEKELIDELGEISGTDSEDRIYSTIRDFWAFELHNSKSANNGLTSATSSSAETNANGAESEWYSSAAEYWDSEANCPLSDDGVLGGYGKLTEVDVQGSNQFLDSLYEMRLEFGRDRAVDCGAGIGRVAKHLLLPRFSQVDLVEQSGRLLAGAPAYIGQADSHRVRLVEIGLQVLLIYDLIWIQWVVGHLTDHDFVRFFAACGRGLRQGGVVVLKDNCASGWTFVVDRSDRSVARSKEYQLALFRQARLRVVMQRSQEGFPDELYPVLMTALALDVEC